MDAFGLTLKRFRMKQGVTQEQLADLIGVSRNTISNWETGTPSSRENVLKLADVLYLNGSESDELLSSAGYSPTYDIRKAGRCDYYAHISLPPIYMERPKLLADVRAALLSDKPTFATRRQKSHALHGMGGIGKTIIVRALCDDPAVQAAFPDGILWLTIGRTPDIVSKLSEWVTALGGTVNDNVPTKNSLKNTLAKLIKNRACLLILDDIWDYSDADDFRLGDSRCHLLVTTRDAGIARELGANIITIKGMDPSEAVLLLEEWAQGHLVKTEQELKNRIVGRVGYLPLAVKLAGAQLQRKTPDEWLQTFDIHKLKSSRDNLVLTLKLSIDDLDPTLRQLYVALAIFHEDEVIPQVGIEKLWQGLGIDTSTAAELIDDLAARALIDVTYLQAGRIVQIHDLLHDLLNAELGDKRLTTHEALLSAYRDSCRGSRWHTADDDGYLYHHLAYHLSQAGMYEELQELFADQHWLNIRFSQQDAYYGYLGDLALAWRSTVATTNRQIEQNEEPTALADVFRCALIWTSIKNLGREYTSELIIRAIEVGLWTIERAFREACNMPFLFQQALTCARLVYTQKLSSVQAAEALELALGAFEQRDGVHAWERARILTVLFPYLESSLRAQLVEQELQSLLSVKDDEEGVQILVLLLPLLDASLRAQLVEQELQSLASVDYGVERARMLVLLLPYINTSLHTQLLDQTLRLAQEQDHDDWLVVLTMLAPFLSTELIGSVLQMAYELKEWLDLGDQDTDWLEILSALAPHITIEQRTQVVEAALTHGDEFLRANLLVPMIPYLTIEQRTQLLESILISEKNYMYPLLSELAPLNLTEKQCDLMFGAIPDLAHHEERVKVVTALAPQLTLRQLQQAMEIVQESSESWECAWILASQSSYVPEEHCAQVVPRVLEIVLAPKPHASLLSLLLLIPHLIYKDYFDGQVSETYLNELLRAELLVKLAPFCTIELLNRILSSPCIVANRWLSILIWAAVKAHTPATCDSWVLDHELEVAQSLKPHWKSALALSALVPLLSARQQTQVFELALHLLEKWDSVKILTALAPYLTEAQHIKVLEVIQAFKNEQAVSHLLRDLAPYLMVAHRSPALGIAHNLKDDFARLEVLTALFPLLTTQQRLQVFNLTLSLGDEHERIHLLVIQAPYLTVLQRSQVLKIALNLENKLLRPVMVATLLPFLGTEQQTEVLNQVLEEDLAPSLGLFSVQPQVALLPFVSDRALILRSIWSRMADFLQNVWLSTPSEVLRSCFIDNNELFAPPILSPAIIEAMMLHIIEIYEEWHWL